MKTSKLITPLITGVLFAAAANTQADYIITATGSTAFRSIAVDAIKSLYDNGGTTSYGSASDPVNGICYYGTMSNNIPSFGNTVVQFRANFSGSAQGAIDVYQHNLISVLDKNSNSVPTAPDLAFTDNWPAAQNPPLKNSLFDTDAIIGVNVFAWTVNDNLYNAGITNLDRERLKLLVDVNGSSVTGAGADLPATYLGGNITNTVYMLGRDIGSGTRITTFANIGYTGTHPVQWAVDANTNLVPAASIAGLNFNVYGLGASTWVKTNLALGDSANGYALDGYDSGGSLVKILNATPNTIGYAGYPDASGNGSTHKMITFQGIAASTASVESGAYPFWSYEHLFSVGNVNGASEKQSIKAALVARITDTNFQNNALTTNGVTSANYLLKAGRLAAMHATRNVDGGPILPKTGY